MVGSRVYVGGLPYGVRERDLERFFKGYGRTRDILIKNGYGFVVSVFALRVAHYYYCRRVASISSSPFVRSFTDKSELCSLNQPTFRPATGIRRLSRC